MPFGDEDLKRLKDNLGWDQDFVQVKLPALIARLEAAERLSASYEKFDFDEDRELLKQEWRRAKGEEAGKEKTMTEQGFCPKCGYAHLSDNHALICLSRQSATSSKQEGQ